MFEASLAHFSVLFISIRLVSTYPSYSPASSDALQPVWGAANPNHPHHHPQTFPASHPASPPFQSPPIPAIPHHHLRPLPHPIPPDHSCIVSSESPSGPTGQDLHHLPQDQIHHHHHHILGWELEIGVELYSWSVRMDQGRVWADFRAQICCNCATLSWVCVLQAW